QQQLSLVAQAEIDSLLTAWADLTEIVVNNAISMVNKNVRAIRFYNAIDDLRKINVRLQQILLKTNEAKARQIFADLEQDITGFQSFMSTGGKDHEYLIGEADLILREIAGPDAPKRMQKASPKPVYTPGSMSTEIVPYERGGKKMPI